MNNNREVIDVEKTDHFMPFSPLIKVSAKGDLYFLSGATALPLYHEHPHEHDKLHPPDDAAAQAKLVMQNIGKCLKAANLDFGDIVRIDCFLTNMDEQDKIGAVLNKYFQGNFPSATMVEVRKLVDPRLKLEINAIAVK